MFKSEGNDKGCCCSAPSYTGVIVYGILTLAIFVWCLINVINPVSDKWLDGEEMNKEQKELVAFYTAEITLLTGAKLIPVVLVLIF